MMTKVTQLFDLVKSHATERWYNFSENEKKIVALLMVACVLSFIYFAIISPLFAWNKTTKQLADLNHETLIFVKQNITRAQQLYNMGTKNNGNKNNLVTFISSTGKKAGIVFSRVQPAKQDIALWINEVSYQQLINWILRLHEEAQVNIKQTRIEKTDNVGMVKVYLRLGY